MRNVRRRAAISELARRPAALWCRRPSPPPSSAPARSVKLCECLRPSDKVADWRAAEEAETPAAVAGRLAWSPTRCRSRMTLRNDWTRETSSSTSLGNLRPLGGCSKSASAVVAPTPRGGEAPPSKFCHLAEAPRLAKSTLSRAERSFPAAMGPIGRIPISVKNPLGSCTNLGPLVILMQPSRRPRRWPLSQSTSLNGVCVVDSPWAVLGCTLSCTLVTGSHTSPSSLGPDVFPSLDGSMAGWPSHTHRWKDSWSKALAEAVATSASLGSSLCDSGRWSDTCAPLSFRDLASNSARAGWDSPSAIVSDTERE